MVKLTLLVLAIILAVLAKEPPIYDYAYSISFDETVLENEMVYKTTGKAFYDTTNGRERIDRANGRYNMFCSSVLPDQSTACTQITVEGKRWVVYPERKECCYCCDSAHGCGVLRPDWLIGADYYGQDTLSDGLIYDFWSKDGVFDSNHFWTTTTSDRVPRRFSENDSPVTDYDVASFKKQTFSDDTFALPSYCSEQTYCPSQSICTEFRSKGLRTQ